MLLIRKVVKTEHMSALSAPEELFCQNYIALTFFVSVVH